MAAADACRGEEKGGVTRVTKDTICRYIIPEIYLVFCIYSTVSMSQYNVVSYGLNIIQTYRHSRDQLLLLSRCLDPPLFGFEPRKNAAMPRATNINGATNIITLSTSESY